MAVAAIITTAPVVRIVLGMATKTGRRGVLISLILVAVEAGRFKMLTQKRVVGFVVIKGRVLPLSRAVASTTVRTHELPMNVIVFVTITTIAGGFAMLFVRRMAVIALNFEVCPDQLKVGKFVFKCGVVE